MLTALFGPASGLAASLVSHERCVLEFEQYTQGYRLPCKVARLPNTSCLALPKVPAQTLLMALDIAGVAVSAGSACSSGKLAPSPVLTAMGEEALAGSAIRLSLGYATTEDEVERFLGHFISISQRLLQGQEAV